MSTGMRKWMEKDCPEIEYPPAQVLIDREELKQLLDRLEATEEDRARFLVEMGRLCAQCDALRAKVAEMERQKPSVEYFDWLPQGTTHIGKIRSVTIPCFGFEAQFNAFKYIDGVLYTYRTDTDNEYGEWVKAASRYRDGVLPTVYPLSCAQGEEE